MGRTGWACVGGCYVGTGLTADCSPRVSSQSPPDPHRCQNTEHTVLSEHRVRELAKSPDHHQLGDGAVLQHQPLSPEPGLDAEVGPHPGHLPRLPRLLLRVIPRSELQRGLRLRQKQRPPLSGENYIL